MSYDLAGGQFFFSRTKWGHPAWSPDSQTILEVGNVLIDAATGNSRRFAGAPAARRRASLVQPDGKLFVKDGLLERLGGKKGEWGIIVGRLDGGGYVVVHRFQQMAGARSWRVSHPHPVFSPDGKADLFQCQRATVDASARGRGELKVLRCRDEMCVCEVRGSTVKGKLLSRTPTIVSGVSRSGVRRGPCHRLPSECSLKLAQASSLLASCRPRWNCWRCGRKM